MSSPAVRYDVTVVPPKPARAPAHYADVHITVGTRQSTIEVECYGARYAAFPGSRETPPEPAGFVLESVEHGGSDITHLFTEDQLEALARLG